MIFQIFQFWLVQVSQVNEELALTIKDTYSADPVNINNISHRVIHDFEDYSNYKNIEITYKEEDSCIFTMNKELSKMLVINLIKNAIIHNKQGGKINIIVTSTFFTIENSSEISELPSEKIFQRFGTKSKERNSTGLGLAIIKTIADFSNLKISNSFNGMHKFVIGQKFK